MENKEQRMIEVIEMRGRMKACGITVSRMSNDLGMSRTTWSRWTNGGDRLQSKWNAVRDYVEKQEKSAPPRSA